MTREWSDAIEINKLEESRTLSIGSPQEILRDLEDLLSEEIFPQRSIFRSNVMNSNPEKIRIVHNGSFDRNQRRILNPEVVLKELFELLEDYAPTWYTEEIHNRAAAVLTPAST